MALPAEYVIQDAVRSIDDVIVYRAEHPIHGIVNVYLPDDTVPAELLAAAKQRLYQNGLQLRNLSMLDVPFITKALEVSQNPNEPYAVTKYVKHDLEELISNGVVIKAKRLFEILSHVIEAIIKLAQNDYTIERIHPRQVKLNDLNSGDINVTIIEGIQEDIDKTRLAYKAAAIEHAEKTTIALANDKEQETTNKKATSTQTTDQDVDSPPISDSELTIDDEQKQFIVEKRNIYLLGDITYQLLFGRKYIPGDKTVTEDIKKLARRWRKILNKTLSRDIGHQYQSYEAMLSDIRKAFNINKRAAISSTPFLLVLIIIGSYFGYERYHKHKIMTSPAGQAIKQFLDIVNRTDDEVLELQQPESVSTTPDVNKILQPFDKIEPIEGE